MMIAQTGQQIELLNILADICPPIGIVLLLLLGAGIIVTLATRRK
jgi:hypothetical protein